MASSSTITASPSPAAGRRRWLRRLPAVVALLWGLALLRPGQAGAATTIVVTTTADVIAADGLCSLREAIVAANSDGAYYGCPAGSGNDTITFAGALPSPATFTLTLAGPGEDGGLTGDLDLSGSTSNTLAIAGRGPGLTIVDGDGADRVFDVHPQARVALSGITVRNGNPGAGNPGGGIAVRTTGRLTLDNCEIAGNTAADGGGVHVLGLLSARDSRIVTNSGGGVRNEAGLLFLERVEVAGNQGVGVANENGGTLRFSGGAVADNGAGGVYNANATAEIDNVTVTGNSGGSGIHNLGQAAPARLTVSQSRVLGNSATSGAGLLNEGPQATATVTFAEIADNTATSGGGGINNSGSLTVAQSVVAGNVARSGGGIDHNGSTLALTNVTIGGNTAGDNGGGLHSRTSATLTNVTVAGNSASGADTGANIYVDGDSAQVTLANSIVAYPGAGGNCANNAGVLHSAGHNLDGESSCGFGAAGDLSNTDPLLAAPAENGGPTPTQLPLPGSPAVDAGDDGACPVADQRSLPRPRPRP